MDIARRPPVNVTVKVWPGDQGRKHDTSWMLDRYPLPRIRQSIEGALVELEDLGLLGSAAGRTNSLRMSTSRRSGCT